jgi:signal transduction histidine kinase
MSTGKEVQFEDQVEGSTFRHHVSPIMDRSGQPWRAAVYSADITEKKRYENELTAYQDQLHRLAVELILTESRERRRLAGELHDRVAQVLFLANMKLNELRPRLTEDQSRRIILEAEHYLASSLEDARSILMDLSPPSLSVLGLESALQSLAQDMERRHKVTVDFVADEEPKPLSEYQRDLVYRSARELLLNAIKHSGAKTIRLEVFRRGEELEVLTADNGLGFDPRRVMTPEAGAGRFGLFSIKERLQPMGGRLRLSSAPGQGAQARLIIPLSREED